MIAILLILFLFGLILILLGSYRITLHGEITDSGQQFDGLLTAWSSILGVCFHIEDSVLTISPVLLGNIIPMKRSGKRVKTGVKHRPAGKKSGPKRSGNKKIKMACAAERLLRRGFQLPANTLKSFSIKSMTVKGQWGSGNPASTGQIWGLIQALGWIIPVSAVSVEPDFTSAKKNLSLDIVIHFILIQLLYRVAAAGVYVGWSLYQCRVQSKGAAHGH